MLHSIHPSSRPDSAHACFALLDDSDATTAAPTSRLYTGHAGTLCCASAAELPGLLAKLELSLAQQLHAVGLFSYELGADMHGVRPRDANQAPPAHTYPAQVLLFTQCAKLSADEAASWLDAHIAGPAQDAGGQSPAGIAHLGHNITPAGFDAAIARIHEAISAGEVYQINYTLRLEFQAFGSPAALYRSLRARQAVPYGALIRLPDGGSVLSLSPELLVRHTEGRLTAQPMKGTAPASGDAATDAAAAASLASDPKNRAENVMITDLLRNDLGRIARYGSVKVEKLFDVQRHGAVLQMTSRIEAQLKENASLSDLFSAVFPCGSITGAPKRRAMQLIHELESAPRGLYTGALGWFEPQQPDAAAGRTPTADFCLSVPIRTLVLQPPDAGGVRHGVLGVGAGIVHDSVAAQEFEECRLKAAFLTGLPQPFELFETMRADRHAGCAHLALHLSRLRQSAQCFGFSFDETAIRDKLAATCSALPAGQAHRLRLALAYSGQLAVQTASLQPLQALESHGFVTALLADTPTEAADIFLAHKTTVRQRYDDAWRQAESQGAFDMLFFNAAGELTEGGRSNVFIRLDGRWYTPPLASGLLPGVMRAVLLADPALGAAERRLYRDDLRAAEALMLCNSLRGAMPARLG